MHEFEFYNPTRIVMATNACQHLPRLIPAQAKVMLVYGQESIKKYGIYDQVCQALTQSNCKIIEFGGITPNPDISKLVEAIYLARKEEVTYLLAVGGGSVIDATKFIASYINFEQFDILLYDLESETFAIAEQEVLFSEHNAEFRNSPVPFGVVLTCPGTGSEMNKWAVISDKYRNLKADFGHEDQFPQFALLDPTLTLSLPASQISYGVVDTFIHVLEQYLIHNQAAQSANSLTTQIAESILCTIMKYGPLTLAHPQDLTYRAEYMWAAAIALCGLPSLGLEAEDWSTHQIGHMLTALFDIPHAPSLALVMCNNLHLRKQHKQQRLVSFARQVLGLQRSKSSDERLAAISIQAIHDFMKNMGLATCLKEKVYQHLDIKAIPETVRKIMQERQIVGFGEYQQVTPELTYSILQLALQKPFYARRRRFTRKNNTDRSINTKQNKEYTVVSPK
ncbi:iron-containing alcohol dehydrogenase [Psittacicella hinzii]|uniref:Uncharacterized protein n=1 Tax=Psittacicella hinzii TaxID=2028575 RepID=A0A3A1YIX6_9GAMM|nr:iron-containing alcohol dehydrogenase [Psittacicella hinzii]RIY37541.1 hypothetical protein CKF58_04845 [Psittacicella hinzii]